VKRKSKTEKSRMKGERKPGKEVKLSKKKKE
jgi:hypothetical protein